MTDQEINQAIAEACGYVRKRSAAKAEFRWYGPDGHNHLAPDDYANDLNAMARAEKAMVNMDDGSHSGCARYVYARHLYSLVPIDQQPIMATARQRAEAFLRTIGKWRDE